MFNDLLRIGNYGANVLSSGFGIATDPRVLLAMNNQQMAEYQRQQGDPANRGWLLTNREMWATLNSLYARPTPKPTMTLAEWDVRRKAFKALEVRK